MFRTGTIKDNVLRLNEKLVRSILEDNIVSTTMVIFGVGLDRFVREYSGLVD